VACFAGGPPSREPHTELEDEDAAALRSLLSSLPSVSFVCITDTIIPSAATATSPVVPWARSATSASRLYDISSRQNRIPTNTTDMPALCDFSFPSTYRFRSATSGEPTALQVRVRLRDPGGSDMPVVQIGIATNSKGCRLSSNQPRDCCAIAQRRRRCRRQCWAATRQAKMDGIYARPKALKASQPDEEIHLFRPSTERRQRTGS